LIALFLLTVSAEDMDNVLLATLSQLNVWNAGGCQCSNNDFYQYCVSKRAGPAEYNRSYWRRVFSQLRRCWQRQYLYWRLWCM